MEIGEVTGICVLTSFFIVYLYARIVDKQIAKVYRDLREEMVNRR